MSQRTLRALVVDDHPLMATAVSTALNATRRFQEIETATSLVDAVQCLEKNPAFSLAVLDMHLSDSDGRESLLRMREKLSRMCLSWSSPPTIHSSTLRWPSSTARAAM
jgi:CheY-like chemotaxis protein